MLTVKKRVDGIPIFNKYDRPLYHLDSEQDSNKYVVIVDEINNFDGHLIELNDCLNEKYEKINIYTKSPLSYNSYSFEDQYSIKSVLNWINKSVWNRKKFKNFKIKKSKSKYNGQLNNEIPLIIKLFKNKNKNSEINTIHCNVCTENNVLNIKNKIKKDKKEEKHTEMKKKQNKKVHPKPSLLCIPIKPSKFNWLKKKGSKTFDADMSIDEFSFQNTNLNNYLPINSNKLLFEQNINIERKLSLKRARSSELTRENSKKRNIRIEIRNEDNENINIYQNNSNNQSSKINNENNKNINIHQNNINNKTNEIKIINKNRQNLQSLVIPPINSFRTNNINSAKNLSASTLVDNEQFDYPKYQEPTSYLPSPCSTASTFVSPSPVEAKVDTKFEIDSCGYADYLKDRINEQQNNDEINEIERKHFSLPVDSENLGNRKNRRRSYAFSVTTNELNLIYSEANHYVLSGLNRVVDNQKHNAIRDETSFKSEHHESEKPFVKGHMRTQSRHRRSHAVCLSNDQINIISNDEDKRNKRRSRYFNKENSSTTLIVHSNSTKDTQLKRRSTNMIKYKNSNSSLSSSGSSNRNSYCSNSGSIRPVSNNRLSRDIDLLRAMKMKRSRSVPKLDQVEVSNSSSCRSPVKSRYSMDVSSYKDSIGISVKSTSNNPPSNIVYYSFNNKNENNSNSNSNSNEGCKKVNRKSYGLFGDTINQINNDNRWSNVFENSSSCGSSTYYYSEEDGAHTINDSSIIVNSKEDLINYESANRSFNDNIGSKHMLPPTPAIGMI